MKEAWYQYHASFFALPEHLKRNVIDSASAISYTRYTFLTYQTEATMGIPEGKFASTVRVGEKGQIVIPKAAREMFNIQPGDTLLLLADVQRGIAIVRQELFAEFTEQVLQNMGPSDEPEE